MAVRLVDAKTAEKDLAILKKEYPHAKYYLTFSNPLQLFVAVILSAQCRDEAVNACTAELFKKYRSVQDFAKLADADVRSITFSKNKAANIRAAMQAIAKHGGKIPQTMAELVALPGIGRKSANVILANAFNMIVGIPVDTHVLRLSYRLGWSREKNPDKVEADLMKLFPRSEWKELPHVLKSHGRAICTAPLPACSRCAVSSLCPKNGVTARA